MWFKITIIVVTFLSSYLYDEYKEEKPKFALTCFWINVVFLSLVFACREFIFDRNLIGTDYYEYQRWFSLKDFSNLFADKNNLGFNFLIAFIKLFTSNYYIFLFIISFLINSLILSFLKKNSSVFRISAFVYVSLFYFITFNVTRQWIAYAILLVALEFLKNKKLIWFTLLTILAATFHTTAVLFIFVYPILNFKKDSKYKDYIIVGTGALLFINYDLIMNLILWICKILNSSYYEKFFTYVNFTANYTQFFLSFIILAWLIACYHFFKVNKHSENQQLILTYLSLNTILCLLATKNTVFNRLTLYCSGALMLSFPLVVLCFRKKIRIFVEAFVYVILIYSYLF